MRLALSNAKLPLGTHHLTNTNQMGNFGIHSSLTELTRTIRPNEGRIRAGCTHKIAVQVEDPMASDPG